MYLGSAWYPEHWDESAWTEDLRLMREAGFNVVRVAEFAWSRMEPDEGRFDLDWLERCIELAAKYGLVTVVGTPSAAPPAWLTHKYPETLAVRGDGRQEDHGRRCHYSPTSAVYRRFCRRIAQEMAKRFGANPHVIGWQIDNEYNSFSHDDDSRAQFQQWLKTRHGTLDALNSRWTTAFWSQEYSDWSQIPLPRGYDNPGLALDFRRFVTHVYRTFQREQIDEIRKHADQRQWITHNFMGYYDLFDHYELSEDLDFASWDNYISLGHLNHLSNGSAHDLTRGFKRKNFWVMETQTGWTCGSYGLTVQNALDRGEIRTLTWHQVGHGADAVLYWQWRSALGGQEQYGGTVVMQDGKPRRQFTEFAQIGSEFARSSDAIDGTSPVSQTAILHSYDDRWIISNYRHHKDFDPVGHLVTYYAPLRHITHEMDVVPPLAPLDDYKLVVAPNLQILDEQLIEHLKSYVLSGGHLVLGARSGVKDIHNAWLPSRQPGPLAELLGAHVDEWYGLDEPYSISGELGTGEVRTWAELLEADAPDVEVLLRYGKSNGWLDDQPAMVTRKVGSGRITYLGAWLDEALMRNVAEWMVRISGIEPPFGPVPDGVEVCRRVGEGKEVFILINHTQTEQSANIPRPMQDVLTGRSHEREINLPPLAVVVLV